MSGNDSDKGERGQGDGLVIAEEEEGEEGARIPHLQNMANVQGSNKDVDREGEDK